MISAAFRDIWFMKKVRPVLKVEDDFAIFRIPNADGTYPFDREQVLAKIAYINVPWHSTDKKGDPFFISIFVFIGLLWDLPLKRVSLPLEKREKYIHRIREFLHGGLVSQTAAESVHGTLCYVTFVYVEGRSHLPAISNFMSSFRGNEVTTGKSVSDPARRECEWWLQTLEQPGRYCRLYPRGELQDLGIFCDASTSWGIGIWIRGHWAAF